MLNDIAFSYIENNGVAGSVTSGDTDATAGKLDYYDIHAARTQMLGNYLNPDMLVTNVQGEADLATSKEYVRATQMGDSTIREGAVGRVAGMDVMVANDKNLSESSGQAYAIDSDQLGYESFRQQVATDRFEDKNRQGDFMQIWTRVGYKVTRPEAAVHIEG